MVLTKFLAHLFFSIYSQHEAFLRTESINLFKELVSQGQAHHSS